MSILIWKCIAVLINARNYTIYKVNTTLYSGLTHFVCFTRIEKDNSSKYSCIFIRCSVQGAKVDGNNVSHMTLYPNGLRGTCNCTPLAIRQRPSPNNTLSVHIIVVIICTVPGVLRVVPLVCSFKSIHYS